MKPPLITEMTALEPGLARGCKVTMGGRNVIAGNGSQELGGAVFHILDRVGLQDT